METLFFLKEQLEDKLAWVIAGIATSLLAFLRKLPSEIIQHIRSKRHKETLASGMETNAIMDKLRIEGSGMLYHLVEYAEREGEITSSERSKRGKISVLLTQ